jgi:hypothetical protein
VSNYNASATQCRWFDRARNVWSAEGCHLVTFVEVRVD